MATIYDADANVLIDKAANELKKINFVFLCRDRDTISNGTNVEMKKPMAKIDRDGIAGKYFTPKIILMIVPGKDNRINKRKKLKASIHFAICFVMISTDLISPLAKWGPIIGNASGMIMFGDNSKSCDIKNDAL